MKTIRLLLILFLLLGINTIGSSQMAGVYGGPSFRKGLFIKDTLTKGTPSFGIGAGVGFVPGGDHDFKFTLDFNYFFPSYDSVLVQVQSLYPFTVQYNDQYDAAAVTSKGFSLGINYGILVDLPIHPLVYTTVSLNMSGTYYKLRYDYDRPNFQMINNDSIQKTGTFLVGPEFTMYYDLDKTMAYASATINYSLAGQDKYEYKMIPTWQVLFNIGLCYKF